MVNSVGNILRLTLFGESHGPAVGGVLDGCPAGIPVDLEDIAFQLRRRKSAQTFFSSSRSEPDEVEFLSGVRDGKTIGTPIGFILRNRDQRPADYQALAEVFRPSHADFAWFEKFGETSGSGGGRTSARVLMPAVVAGSIAKAILGSTGVSVLAWVSSIGPVNAAATPGTVTTEQVRNNPLNCPDETAAAKMMEWLETLKTSGDTCGGTITCRITCVPAGLGEPVFSKLHAALAHAMMSINSVKAFEYGSGFEAARMKGSEYNDLWNVEENRAVTLTNHDGGINGGISNGQDIVFRIAFKPVPSIALEQQTIDIQKKPVKLKISGRHDTCVVPRSVSLVESLATLVIADHYLMQTTRTYK